MHTFHMWDWCRKYFLKKHNAENEHKMFSFKNVFHFISSILEIGAFIFNKWMLYVVIVVNGAVLPFIHPYTFEYCSVKWMQMKKISLCVCVCICVFNDKGMCLCEFFHGEQMEWFLVHYWFFFKNVFWFLNVFLVSIWMHNTFFLLWISSLTEQVWTIISL